MSDIIKEEAGSGVSKTKEIAENQVIPEAGPLVMDDAVFDKEESAREAAYDGVASWNGVELMPFSVARESLLYHLRSSMAAPPIASILTDVVSFIPDALRVLYICAHTQEDLRPLRANPVLFQEAVEDWADKNITTAQLMDAGAKGLEIYISSELNKPQSPPSESGADGDAAGN